MHCRKIFISRQNKRNCDIFYKYIYCNTGVKFKNPPWSMRVTVLSRETIIQLSNASPSLNRLPTNMCQTMFRMDVARSLRISYGRFTFVCIKKAN